MNVSSPEIPPGFTYVLVPCDAQKPLIEHTLSDGPTDENFREKVSSYFKTTATLSTAQKEEARQHLLSCSQSDTKTNNASDQRLMGEILANRDPTFEIVPVIMPTRSNGFIGVSLYIDEVGRFKELPLNDRASKLAQRDIRGDAFLSRNEDDPCKETWSRVSTTSTEVEDLLKNPPSAAVSSSIQNHAVTDLGGKAAESRKLTVEDIETAKEKKARGGQHFAAGDYDQADILYAEVYDALNGREDFLPDSIRASGTVSQLRQTALLNRAQCRLRLKDYAQSASFARTVLSTLNPDSIKAHYILVNSCLSLSDFDVAKEVIEHVVHTLVPQAPLDDNEKRETLDAFHRLGLELEQQRRQYHEKEKKMYANIFA